MACLPTPPAPRMVTLTGGRAVERKRRPAPLQGVEGGGQPVAGHLAQVLDQAPAVVAGDHVERDRLDAQAAQQLDALRPRGEVEHREQDRAGPEQLVAPFGRPQHHHDVLGVRRGLVDDVDPRRLGQVVVVRSSPCRPRSRSRRRRRRPVSASRPISGGRKARRSPGSLYMRGKPIVSRRSSVISCLGRWAPRGRPPGAGLERRWANDPPTPPSRQGDGAPRGRDRQEPELRPWPRTSRPVRQTRAVDLTAPPNRTTLGRRRGVSPPVRGAIPATFEVARCGRPCGTRSGETFGSRCRRTRHVGDAGTVGGPVRDRRGHARPRPRRPQPRREARAVPPGRRVERRLDLARARVRRLRGGDPRAARRPASTWPAT